MGRFSRVSCYVVVDRAEQARQLVGGERVKAHPKDEPAPALGDALRQLDA
jgi:hypothetical protein